MSLLRQYLQLVKSLFSPGPLILCVAAVIGTTVLVFSGLDWIYFVFVYTTFPSRILFVADIVGFIIPVITCIVLLYLARREKNTVYQLYASGAIYAVVLGFTLSEFLKIFTGRTSPPHLHHGTIQPLIDNSHAFHFGFMREQIIGGWPSSHTTIAFALATTFALLLPPRWYVRTFLFGIASFIGIGESFGFHWLSEVFAGACLGMAIGIVVGKRFRN